jgi:hypothetical protein
MLCLDNTSTSVVGVECNVDLCVVILYYSDRLFMPCYVLHILFI